MAEDAAAIEMVEGDPGAVSDAGASLGRVSGAFERMAGGVGRAVSVTGSWEGYASVSFAGAAASYGQAAGAVDGVLAKARAAVARYGDRLADARARIGRLQDAEQDCIERLRIEKRRLEDAQVRASEGRTRLSNATFSVGLDATPFSMAEQAGALDQIQAAEADAQRAERAIARERAELDRLREQAKQEREELEDAESEAAAAVRGAAAELPDVRLASGAVAPSALAGTPFGPGLMSPAQRDLLAAGRNAEGGKRDEDGDILDGLGKMAGDVTDEVSGLAEGAFNHVNVTNPDKFGDTWSNDWGIVKNVVGDPPGAAEAAFNGTIQPLKDSYESGGIDEAIGRSPSVIAGIFGGKGLNKLDQLDQNRSASNDSGDGGSDEDGGNEGAAPSQARPTVQPNLEFKVDGEVFARSDADGNVVLIPREQARATVGDPRQALDEAGSLNERIAPSSSKHGTPPPKVRTKREALMEATRVLGKALEDLGG